MKQRRARSLETLALVLVGWTALRIGITLQAIAPDHQRSQNHMPTTRISGEAIAPASAPSPPQQQDSARRSPALRAGKDRASPLWQVPLRAFRSIAPTVPESPNYADIVQSEPKAAPAEHLRPALTTQANFEPERSAYPISGAAWLLWRPAGAGRPLGTGGQLGGSQAGVRVLLPLAMHGALRASLRGTMPLASPSVYEVSPGISVRPFKNVALEVIAERRLRAGAGEHDATSVFASGGFSARSGSSVHFEGYAQAGGVGMHRTMWFADGAASLRRAVSTSIDVGGGIWGGIQPGVKRLDIGPSAAFLLPVGRRDVRLTADWRFRIAGDAKPGSGPAITLGTNF